MNTDEIPVDWSSFPRRRESYNAHSVAIVVRLLPITRLSVSLRLYFISRIGIQ
ncbi:hypothetical protein SRABI27_04275 [Pedobacter sp. Bi27]|nr:hypothetical protein SRABI27_04275 [Pedobacter sp. Bi27]